MLSLFNVNDMKSVKYLVIANVGNKGIAVFSGAYHTSNYSSGLCYFPSLLYYYNNFIY